VTDNDRAARLSLEARKILTNVTLGTVGRMADFSRATLVPSGALPIAKQHAGERTVELMTRALAVVQELLREGSAVSVLAYTSRMLGTYSAETMREIYLAAVREAESGSKPGERRCKAVKDLAVAWRDCTGKKATASFNRTDGCERPTPFVRFAGSIFAAAGVEISNRTIRLDLARRNHNPARKVARGSTKQPG
jgi:hypothetical protein